MTTESRRFLRDAWRILMPYWRSEDRRTALVLLAAIVFLNLGAVYVLVLLNSWNRAFYDALQQRDFAAFTHELGHFCLLAGLFIVTAVYRQYLTQTLEMRWRRWLTEVFLRGWLGDRVYYRFEHIHRGTDNPDQRIAEDLKLLAGGSLSLASGLLNAAVTLVSFIGILWTLSGPLAVPLGGWTINIPAYLVWAAILYALGGSFFTHRIGRPLVSLNAEQQRTEADFRFSLVRLRENAEEVALYGGEPLEQQSLRRRFTAILDNWWRRLRVQKRLTWFTAGYGQAATVFPILVAAPRYFSGAIQLGTLMQIASAFGRVQDALSWFVDSYANLAEWKASMDRVLVFEQGMAAAAAPGGDGDIRIVTHAESEIVLDHVDIALPSGATLVRDASLVVRRGRARAPDRAVRQRKEHHLPDDRGSLALRARRDSTAGRRTHALSTAALVSCRSPRSARPSPIHPIRRCSATARSWSHSGGACSTGSCLAWRGAALGAAAVARRAAAAGAGTRFLHAPAWLFLDEATSALDEATERYIYRELRTHLPGTRSSASRIDPVWRPPRAPRRARPRRRRHAGERVVAGRVRRVGLRIVRRARRARSSTALSPPSNGEPRPRPRRRERSAEGGLPSLPSRTPHDGGGPSSAAHPVARRPRDRRGACEWGTDDRRRRGSGGRTIPW